MIKNYMWTAGALTSYEQMDPQVPVRETGENKTVTPVANEITDNLTYILDLSRSFNLSEPPYTTISKLDKSAYSAGALFPSQDGQLYQFAGLRQVYIYKETLSGATKTWYDNEVAQGEKGNSFRLWDFDVDSNEWHQGVELDGGVPQRVWRGASAMMPKRGVGYYLGGLQVGEDGFFDSESGGLYDRLTKYEVGGNFSTDVGPDASGLGRWDGAMVAIEEIGKEGILVALGGNRATYATTSVPRTLVCFCHRIGDGFSDQCSLISKLSRFMMRPQGNGLSRRQAARTHPMQSRSSAQYQLWPPTTPARRFTFLAEVIPTPRTRGLMYIW
jgi:hypothetical protein